MYIIKINKVNYGHQHFTWNRKFVRVLLGKPKPVHDLVIMMLPQCCAIEMQYVPQIQVSYVDIKFF